MASTVASASTDVIDGPSAVELLLCNGDLVHLLGTYMEDADRENYIIAISTIVPPAITRDEGKRLLDIVPEMCDDCGKRQAKHNFGDGFVCSWCYYRYKFVQDTFTTYHPCDGVLSSCTYDKWYVVCRMAQWTDVSTFSKFFNVRDMLFIFENLSVKSRPALRYARAVQKLDIHREFEQDGVFSPDVDVSTLTHIQQKARKAYLAFTDHDIDGISAGTSFMDLTYGQINQLMKYNCASPGELSTDRGFEINLRLCFGPDIRDSFFWSPYYRTYDIDFVVFGKILYMLRRWVLYKVDYNAFQLFESWVLDKPSIRLVDIWVRNWARAFVRRRAST